MKKWLEDRLAGQEIILQSVQDKKGKFGRWLGILSVDGVKMNEELVESGRAEKL